MKAIVCTQYGSPEVLQLQEVDKPVPKEDHVLVRVHAAAANPADWRHMRGTPFLVRFEAGLRKPKQSIFGVDVAGQVAAVGSRVTQYKPGDAVFGEIEAGGFAEYVAVPEQSLALKPAHLSFEEAASLPCVAFTAIQGLRDTGQLQAGERVLINGASGGVGTFAVQFAKALGAEVTGVCSTPNLELVRSLGATHVIDYTREDFTQVGRQYDLIFDAVGNRAASDLKQALKPGGRCVVAGFTTMMHMLGQIVLRGTWVSMTSQRKIVTMGAAQANPIDLQYLKELLETSQIKPVIDRCYALRETADAIRYLETGRARGKVIINMEETHVRN